MGMDHSNPYIRSTTVLRDKIIDSEFIGNVLMICMGKWDIEWLRVTCPTEVGESTKLVQRMQ